MMHSIPNTWVEKIKKKKSQDTAPSYESNKISDDFAYSTRRPEKRHAPSLIASFKRTLRGVRK